MKFLIIGSVAVWHHTGGKSRCPKDIDTVTSEGLSTLVSSKGLYDTKSGKLFEMLSEASKDKVFCDLDTLCTLKLSHAGWDIHWVKTVKDIAYLKEVGAVPNEELYQKLVQHWNVVHGDKSKVRIDKPLEEFFSQEVSRVFEHDYLHELLKYFDVPVYKKLQRDFTSAYCTEELWRNLSETEKLACVVEEITVLATERVFLKTEEKYLPNQRVKVILYTYMQRLATSMSRGYFSRFICENTSAIIPLLQSRVQTVQEVLKRLHQESSIKT